MKRLTFISFCCLFIAANISAQVVSSKEVKIHINNKTSTGVAEQTNIMSREEITAFMAITMHLLSGWTIIQIRI